MSDVHAPEIDRPARRRRSDGERSRNAILREAAQLATVEGIGGLSLARLAEAVGMSKSGLFAHFGSKQELQLATIGAANALFNEHVIEPASDATAGLAAHQPGLGLAASEKLRRLRALLDSLRSRAEPLTLEESALRLLPRAAGREPRAAS